MDSCYICGGQGTASTRCLYFSCGQWITSHTLTEGRDGHSSWETDQGRILMGGYLSPYTSEMVTNDGNPGVPAFSGMQNTHMSVL